MYYYYCISKLLLLEVEQVEECEYFLSTRGLRTLKELLELEECEHSPSSSTISITITNTIQVEGRALMETL